MPVLSTLRRSRGALSLGLAALVLLFATLRFRRRRRRRPAPAPASSLSRLTASPAPIGVNAAFWADLWALLKLTFCRNGIPGLFALFNLLLVLRTLLTIRVSTVKGRVVKAIVSSSPRKFADALLSFGLLAVPGSLINSWLEYLQELLSLRLRTGLVAALNSKYLHGKAFYQVLNVDSRVTCPDQVLTDDVAKWARTLAELYCDFSKPLLDIALFSRKIAAVTSAKGPLLMVGWYVLAGWLLKVLSPAFSRLVAELLRREGAFRAAHQRVKAHAEEIAFLRGDGPERGALDRRFAALLRLHRYENGLRFGMGVVDSVLVKYGSYNVGVAILGLPVFGPDKQRYLARVSSDPALIMKDYEQNTTLLINLARAIGKIVISYKKLQALAGATARVARFMGVLDDLVSASRYERTLVANRDLIWDDSLGGCALAARKVWKAGDFLKFEDVPILTPNGELLLHALSLKIKAGKSCLVVGANGTGKTALLRVLAGLWPFFQGKISKVAEESLLFLPQKVYLPRARLRELITYPHVRPQKSDAELLKILESVRLEYLHEREGGFDAVNDWYDMLSGGERQRVSVARLFYHVPQFAVLDEATSAVSVEIENTLYLTAKQLGITLVTVTQRKTLDQFHDYVLRIKDNCEWEFEELRADGA